MLKQAERRRIDAFELWCWRRLLRVPWTASRSIQSILKEISPWVFIGRTDVETETPILWSPDAKNWLIGKDPDAGRDLGQGEKGTTEDKMAGWHHRFDGHEFEWTPGVGDGQEGLACCNSWDYKESDTIEWLNWTELMVVLFLVFNGISILSSIVAVSTYIPPAVQEGSHFCTHCPALVVYGF